MSHLRPLLQPARSHVWNTPPAFFAMLDEEFAFQLDAAASADNALCPCFFTEFSDALAHDWYPAFTSIYCNPPYGRGIGRWVAKAWAEAQRGATVVMLLPARTDTAWWHDWVMRADEVRLVRGRLNFSGSDNAPFPNAVVVFRPDADRGPLFSSIGRAR